MIFQTSCVCGTLTLVLAVTGLCRPAVADDAPVKIGEMGLTTFTESMQCVALSPDGKTLAVGGGNFHGPGDLLVVDIGTGRKVWASSKHRLAIWSLAFSPDGKLLASGGGDGEINLWDAATGKHRAALDGHRGYVQTLLFSSDGKALVGQGTENFVKVWDVAATKVQATFRFPFRNEGKARLYAGFPELPEEHAKLTVDFKLTVEGLLGIALSPDDKILAAATAEKEVKLWSVATGEEVAVIKTDHADVVTHVEFSPNGKLLATGGGREDGSIRLWDVKTGKRVGSREGHKDSILGLAFTPDGKTLVSVCSSTFSDEVAKVWDVDKQKERITLNSAQDYTPWSLALARDGKWFVTVGGKNSVRRFSIEEGKELPIGE